MFWQLYIKGILRLEVFLSLLVIGASAFLLWSIAQTTSGFNFVVGAIALGLLVWVTFCFAVIQTTAREVSRYKSSFVPLDNAIYIRLTRNAELLSQLASIANAGQIHIKWVFHFYELGAWSPYLEITCKIAKESSFNSEVIGALEKVLINHQIDKLSEGMTLFDLNKLIEQANA